MGGIKENVTSEDVTEYFEKYGKVESVELLQDKASGKKRGFGFVNFDDYDVVDKIVQTRRHVISGVSIEVSKAFSKEDQTRKAGFVNNNGYYGYDAFAWAGGFRGGNNNSRGGNGVAAVRGRPNGRRPMMNPRNGHVDPTVWYAPTGARGGAHFAPDGRGGGYADTIAIIIPLTRIGDPMELMERITNSGAPLVAGWETESSSSRLQKRLTAVAEEMAADEEEARIATTNRKTAATTAATIQIATARAEITAARRT